jgi:hypothetical protein
MVVVEELPLTVQSVRVTLPPSLYSPPPLPVVLPPVIVSPEMEAVTPPSTWNTRLSPPPLTVRPAAGAAIVSVPLAALSSSGRPARVIVWAVAKTVLSQVIVWPGSALALAIASRRLVLPSLGSE